MARKKERTNPFYVLLVIFGVIFSITACAYGLMALKAFSPVGAQANSDAGKQLLQFLDKYGMYLMLSELGLLGVSTFAAMATDSYWAKMPEDNEGDAGEE